MTTIQPFMTNKRKKNINLEIILELCPSRITTNLFDII